MSIKLQVQVNNLETKVSELERKLEHALDIIASSEGVEVTAQGKLSGRGRKVNGKEAN